jgi:hypothetical protein
MGLIEIGRSPPGSQMAHMQTKPTFGKRLQEIARHAFAIKARANSDGSDDFAVFATLAHPAFIAV